MIIIKYNELLKENKTLQRKIEETKTENEKLLNLSRDLNKEVIELKREIIRLTKEKERLLNELETTQNPISELIRMTKGMDIF